MYSQITMRKDIKSLGIKSDVNPFQWEQSKNISEQLRSRYPYTRGQHNFINDLTEYCWQVYQKAFYALGPMIIGRVADLWNKPTLEKYKIKVGDTLWMPKAQGNILVMDKWAGVLNDAWLLGGIHRRADFRLVSYLSPENLWNYPMGYHVVTAREVMGLLNFGYTMTRNRSFIIFKCNDYVRANGANLITYDFLMKKMLLTGISSINSILVEPSEGLLQQIQTFDYSTLKKITYDVI
ncbi:TPA: hypothetical protein ACQ39K_004127 [Yersinia enterocolitica]